MPGRPLIAISGAVETHRRERELAVPALYLEAIERAGGEPAALFPVPLDVEAAAQRLRHFGGLVLTGGGDVDPAAYSQEPGPHVYGVDAVRDAFEMELFRAAVRLDLPVLAICRGPQLINAALGGTLDQHITQREDLQAHGVPRGGDPVVHPVRLEAGSRLAQVMQVERVDVSSHHHQVVDRVGEGWHPVAWAEDGVVEGLETDSGWVVGVQWHPEDTADRDPAQQRLFDALVEQAARFRLTP